MAVARGIEGCLSGSQPTGNHADRILRRITPTTPMPPSNTRPIHAEAGSGTAGVAAVKLGMQFIGIECDPAAFAGAQERIEAGSASGMR